MLFLFDSLFDFVKKEGETVYVDMFNPLILRQGLIVLIMSVKTCIS